MIEHFANPYYFKKMALRLLPFTAILSIIFLIIGLYLAFFGSPPDYQQKETVRIMYIHVPSAWCAMGIFFGMGVNSIFILWRRHHTAFMMLKAMAPIGACFAFICLVTGSLWGKPTWGTYWIWDARLTSMLILLILYIAVILLYNAIHAHQKAMKVTAIFCFIGLIDLPIIKFSVEWWHTLHQGPSIIKAGGPSIHATMLWPLSMMALFCLFFSISMILLGTVTQIEKR